jgi:quinol monooxygenase YgiN
MARMHARSTTISADPAAMDDGIAYVRDEVMPRMRAMDGCVGLSMLADRTSGSCLVTTSWADEAALRASEDAVRALAERTVQTLGGTPELQEWEIAAMHRVHEPHPATACRVTWLRSDPGSVDRAVDAVRLSLMPKLDDLPGFCSISVMVRREDGLTVAAVSYDTADDLAAAAEGAREFREEFAPTMGIEALETAEFEVAIAHLRVPETL